MASGARLTNVLRDPICLARWREQLDFRPAVGFMYWPYLNRIPGAKELGCEFLKGDAMLGLSEETLKSGTMSLGRKEPDEKHVYQAL